ncbi:MULTISPECIES: bifunctional nuclease family protein [unclassified Desulfovibrio]|uniref:bifunctional nuclease family protein n=1 Tax=unclassified Desulfovibrio TaxID=2593640 RepID=UPI000F5D6036|nr:MULTISPECIES: bifunctional nuclease family protein [unclassified Desulfovibrio]RRD72300.1 bifunctional nuclease family protein [Desulfovibrio sp. OH1209_COT-279]RRD88411.1 bifunctional nuclease family protein [Desulfovibrio sp. OH1186_COT-070]
MTEMRVFGLTIDPQSKTPVVVLRAVDGDAILPMWVGAMEAMAVSLVLNREALPRPLTHDLMIAALTALKSRLQRVEIIDLKEGTYYALLILHGPEGSVQLDCRPSDAVALAIRANAPIMVCNEVLRRYAESREKSKGSSPENVAQPVPDAATDMVRQAGARRATQGATEGEIREKSLPEADDDQRYQDMLRSLDPVSQRKM